MIPVALTQRVISEPCTNERRDCLDQAWTRFFTGVGLLPVPLPNDPRIAVALCEAAGIAGIVLTGGDDLVAYGGATSERDATESALLDFATARGLPLLGVCRGMQVIQHRFGVPLRPVAGHVTPRHRIIVEGKTAEVNSYHRLGTFETSPVLPAWARAEDGVIEAVRYTDGPLLGIMWHPERTSPATLTDIGLFRHVFATSDQCAA